MTVVRYRQENLKLTMPKRFEQEKALYSVLVVIDRNSKTTQQKPRILSRTFWVIYCAAFNIVFD